MPSPPFDPGIRRALRDLNRIPGTKTRSSCQGKSSLDEASRHADLAYVTFRSPVPLALEDHLVATIGDVARIDSSSVYSRWPERNLEFCARLTDAGRTFLEMRRGERWEEAVLSFSQLLEPIEALLDSAAPVALSWCLDCRLPSTARSDAPGKHAPDCRLVALLKGSPERRLDLFERFLAADERPPDPTLRKRLGDATMLERVEHGDFGNTYRRAWATFRSRTARDLLQEEIRSAVAAERARGVPLDYYFRPGKVIFSHRESPQN